MVSWKQCVSFYYNEVMRILLICLLNLLILIGKYNQYFTNILQLYLPPSISLCSDEGDMCTFKPEDEHMTTVASYDKPSSPGDVAHLQCDSQAWNTVCVDCSETIECVWEGELENGDLQAYWDVSVVQRDLCQGDVI